MLEHFLHAIETCNQGILPFNQGNIRAFRYRNKWYPLRAIFVCAYQLAGQAPPTTNEALVYLTTLVRIADIDFRDNFPVPLNEQNILNEIRHIAEALNGLLEN